MASVSKTFNELVAFTRSTSATYVNSAGYIATTPVTNYITYSNQSELWTKFNAFVQTNLVLWSEQFDNATWIKGSAGVGVVPVVTANQGVAPDGTLTADRVDFNCGALTITDRSYITQAVTVTAGVAYTDSIWIKAFDTATVGKTIRFVLESGGASGTNVFTITNQWQRIVVSGAGAVAASVNVLMETRGTYTSSTTASVLVWGAQLVQGAVPGDYRATTSAALPCLYADYSGQLRARKICEDASVSSLHYVASIGTFNAPAGQPYTFSVKVKTGEQKQIGLELNSGIFVSFNTTTGTVVSTNTYSGGVIVNTAITSLGSGWYLCSVAGYNPSAVTTAAYVEIGGTNYTGNGTNGMYIADAQLAPGTVPGPYYDTGSTITYAQRRDFSPSTLACLGLLVEEQRTNLAIYSEQFDQWALGVGVTVLSNAAVAPDGTTTADRVTFATGGSFDFLRRNTPMTIGTVYTISVYALSTGNSPTFYFDIGNGSVVQSPIQTPTSTWQRFSYTFTFAGANQWADIETSAPGSIVFWGGQIEAGTSATSYIPTVATQVTRAADVASVNLLSPWYNSSAWTLYLEYVTKALAPVGGNTRVIELNNGTVNSRALFYATPPASGDGLAFQVRDAGVDQTTPSFAGANVVGAILKEAAAAKANDFAFTVNGASPSVDVSGTLPTFSQFNIASVLSGGANEVLNGWLRRITFYPQRLTNAQLQSITT